MKFIPPISFLSLVLTLITSCQNLNRVSSHDFDISQVKSWAYQLQDADPNTIASSGFDLMVMDYSRDGTEATRYAADEIDEIKKHGIIPIAYISIGEAEDYRFYWKEEWYINPPPWLGNENPEWEGNYAVRYWNNEWKQIVFEYLSKVIEQGFLGVYLDRVDAFEYWSDCDNGEDECLSEKEAAKRMIDFVEEIAHYCRVVKREGDFYIIPQNGEKLLDYESTYLRTISGIAVEDLFYYETEPIPQDETEGRIKYLDKVARANKPVFVVDYVDDGTGYFGSNRVRIDDFRAKAISKGYIPYVAKSDRELDELNIISGVQP